MQFSLEDFRVKYGKTKMELLSCLNLASISAH